MLFNIAWNIPQSRIPITTAYYLLDRKLNGFPGKRFLAFTFLSASRIVLNSVMIFKLVTTVFSFAAILYNVFTQSNILLYCTKIVCVYCIKIENYHELK